MAIPVGGAFISVSPSLRGWHQQVRQQLKKELAGISAKLPIEGDFEPIKREAPKKGAEAGGAFARSFKARVEAALKSLPDIKVNADSTPAQRAIAEIRKELVELSGKTVGVDIDAASATAEVQRIQGRLNELDSHDVSPDLRLDTAAASAELARFKAKLDGLEGDRASVDVDADTAAAAAQLTFMSRLVSGLDGRRASISADVDGNALRSSLFLTQQVNGLVLAGASIAPVFVPAFAAAAAGAIGLAGAVASAGAGVGALVAVSLPAFSAVSDAVKATEQAEKAAATSTVSTTKQRTQAAYQAVQAASRVADAQRAADRTATEGARRVEDAQRGVGEARRRAAEQVEQANERVDASERTLERSHESVRRAQEDLTRARKEAARALEDLREQTSDLARSEEGAQISLERARERLAEVNRDATASALDRREAALEVADAEDRLSDVQRDRARTSKELSDVERSGIDGTEGVRSANERLMDAQLGVVDAQRDNVAAQADLARAQADGARGIADAERSLADARTQAAEASADAARQVADAMAAQAQAAEMATLQSEQGTAGARNLAYALGELTPMQAALYTGFLRLRDAFQAWAQSLEPAVIPLFLSGMGLVERMLPQLTPLVLAAAGAFETLLARASDALGSPFWRTFFDYLAGSAGPAIVGFGTILGNLARGFAGLLMAFWPFAAGMTGGLVELTSRFAQWGADLGQSEGFRTFISYIQTVWPPLKETLLAIGRAFVAITTALAPLGGGPVLTIVRTIANVIAGMDPATLAGIAAGIGAIALATKGWGIAQAILTASFGSNVFLLAIVGIAGLVAWLVRGYQTSEEFRARVDQAIAPLKDTFDRVVETGKGLWRDVIQPLIPEVMRFAEAALGLGATLVNIGLPVFAGALTVLGWILREVVLPPLTGLINFLAENEHFIIGFAVAIAIALVPSFIAWAASAGAAAAATLAATWPILAVIAVLTALVAGIVWAYQNVDWFRTGVDALGDVFQWLWREAIQPAWNGIVQATQIAWHMFIKPVLEAIWGFITGTLGPIFSWLWNSVIVPVWEGIQQAIAYAWFFVIKPVFQAVWDFITNTLAPKFQWLWNEVIQPVWKAISDGISFAWHFVIKPIWDAIMTFIDEKLMPKFTQLKDWVVGVMQSMGDILGGIWDGVVTTIRNAINAAIDVINTIIRGIKWVADKLGITIDIREIGHVGETGKSKSKAKAVAPKVPLLATGGQVPEWPGGSGWVNRPRAIVGEGDPTRPELVIATDPKYRVRNLGLWAEAGNRLGVPGFKAGGHLPGDAAAVGAAGTRFGQIMGNVHNVSALDQASAGIDWMAMRAANAAWEVAKRTWINPAIDNIPHTWNVGGLMQGAMRYTRDKVGQAWVDREDARLDAIKSKAMGSDSGPLPKGPGIWGLYDPLAAVVSKIVAAGRGAITGWGWRSSQRQAELYARWKAGVPGQAKAAPPGKSNHEQGAAVDWSGNVEMARRLSRDHGLIQPMSFEPWHWEHPRQGRGRGGPAGMAGAGVQRWRGVFLQALQAAGKPAGWVESGLRRMQQESGGNPQAINNWDSNAKRGTPSKGLMQVIDPTFRAYAGPMLGRGVWDPLANIYASIQYATARYGSAPRGWDRPGGYADGAWKLPHDGLLFAHQDEMILPAGAAEDFRTGMAQAGAASVKGAVPAVEQHFHGITDPVAQARATSDELAWRIRVGAG